jgi:Spy/CpxP family protein refolding chaperone
LKPQTSSKLWPLLLAVALCLLCASLTFAQPEGSPPPNDRGPRERIETVIIGKFSTELNLTPDQAEKFFPRFKQFQNEVRELHKSQMENRGNLNDLARNKDADQSHVKELVAKQSENEKKISALKQDFLNDVSNILTPQQVSKCSILLDELPRRVQQFIEDRREHGSNPDMRRDRMRQHAH